MTKLPRVGFVGLGKLGLPVALAVSSRTGEVVRGFDLNPDVKKYGAATAVPYEEARVSEFFESASVQVNDSIEDLLDNTDLVFLAVQTPHERTFEGVTPVPTHAQDFDYSHLVGAVTSIVDYLQRHPHRELTISVISTVLPGTMASRVLPILKEVEPQVRFCYNPFFIAMGSTIDDFLNPEFVLVGEKNPGDSQELARVYRVLHQAELHLIEIESAELAKVAYNTFIGFKIVFANSLSEIVSNRGGDVDEVTGALARATDRLLSPKYLRAGMGDGGGCHPRDQIAMSWLADELGLSANIFDFLARARDAQTLSQAKLLAELAAEKSLPVVLLGLAYKKDVNLTIGSPALLLKHFLEELDVDVRSFDPFVAEEDFPSEVAVFFVSMNHSMFRAVTFPAGSTVVDPWGDAIGDHVKETCTVIRPGRKD